MTLEDWSSQKVLCVDCDHDHDYLGTWSFVDDCIGGASHREHESVAAGHLGKRIISISNITIMIDQHNYQHQHNHQHPDNDHNHRRRQHEVEGVEVQRDRQVAQDLRRWISEEIRKRRKHQVKIYVYLLWFVTIINKMKICLVAFQPGNKMFAVTALEQIWNKKLSTGKNIVVV